MRYLIEKEGRYQRRREAKKRVEQQYTTRGKRARNKQRRIATEEKHREKKETQEGIPTVCKMI